MATETADELITEAGAGRGAASATVARSAGLLVVAVDVGADGVAGVEDLVVPAAAVDADGGDSAEARAVGRAQRSARIVEDAVLVGVRDGDRAVIFGDGDLVIGLI